jgi:hypothetical protein
LTGVLAGLLQRGSEVFDDHNGFGA